MKSWPPILALAVELAWVIAASAQSAPRQMPKRREFATELAPVAPANANRPQFPARLRPDTHMLPTGAVRLAHGQAVEPRPDKIRLPVITERAQAGPVVSERAETGPVVTERAQAGLVITERTKAGPVVTEPAKAAARPVPAEAIRVIAGEGRITQDESGTSWLEQSKVGTSVLSSDDARAGTTASLLSTGAKTLLPWLIVDARQRPRGNDWRTARPFLKLARAIQWEPASGRHVAQFLVGLDAEDGDAGPLTNPVRARFIVSCDEVTPADVILGAVGPAGDQTVAVACSPKVKNERAQQSLSIRLAKGSLEYRFEIPHRIGAFQLLSAAESVLGLGIDSLRVTVVRSEEDRTPLPVSSALEVPLQARGSEIDPSHLTIPKGESQATVSVRPRGVGTLHLSAGASAQESEALPIELTWPVFFLLVTLVGGALGGYLCASRRRERKAGLGLGWQYAARRAAEGALVGLVAILATLALPSIAIVPESLRSNEVGWFVVAVLAGFSGIELVDTLATLLFRKKDQPAASAQSN